MIMDIILESVIKILKNKIWLYIKLFYWRVTGAYSMFFTQLIDAWGILKNLVHH